jgi:putative salt-induced outer membrane protein
MKLSLVWLSLATLMPVMAVCADAPPPMHVWAGKGQLGVVASQGNTDATSVNAVLDLARLDGQWQHAFHLGGLYGKNSGITSAERWDALFQSNYDFAKNLYTFGSLRYARDMFSGFQYQASVATGLGYKFIDTDTTKLSAQVGAGYRKSRDEQLLKNAAGAVTGRIPGASSSDAILTAGVDYSQALSGSTTLSNKILLESGSSNTLLTDTLALTVQMSEKLALSVGYRLQYNTKPPAGLKKLDSVETVNLVFVL